MVRLLCLALVVCGVAAAQGPAPLSEIEIVGADHYSKDAIIEASGLKIGETVTEADFHEALARFGTFGVFESYEFRYTLSGTYKVTFTVTELGPFYALEFQGFDDSREELSALLREKIPLYTDRIPPVGPLVELIGNALEEHWKSQGHESDVIGQLEDVGAAADELVMLFRPQERLPSISYVAFENSEVISAFDLQGFFNRIARGEIYSDARIKELLRYNVRPLYEEKGYMGVEFCPCTAEDDPENLGLRVTVHVEEGAEYTYGRVPLPEIEGFEEKKIENLWSPKAGNVVNMKEARTSQAEIEELFRANGFLRAQTQLDMSVNHDAKTVHLELTYEPGYRYTFDKLTIEGLDILAEPIIRKRWGLEGGAPYAPRYAAFFLNRLREENAFEGLQDTRFKEDINEATKQVSVTLQFIGQEKKRLYPAANSEPVNDPF